MRACLTAWLPLLERAGSTPGVWVLETPGPSRPAPLAREAVLPRDCRLCRRAGRPQSQAWPLARAPGRRPWEPPCCVAVLESVASSGRRRNRGGRPSRCHSTRPTRLFRSVVTAAPEILREPPLRSAGPWSVSAGTRGGRGRNTPWAGRACRRLQAPPAPRPDPFGVLCPVSAVLALADCLLGCRQACSRRGRRGLQPRELRLCGRAGPGGSVLSPPWSPDVQPGQSGAARGSSRRSGARGSRRLHGTERHTRLPRTLSVAGAARGCP